MSISEKRETPDANTANLKKSYSTVFKFCHRKKVHHFFLHVYNCLLVTFDKSPEKFKMDSDVSRCPELQVER